jgi:hypothetical protein
MTMTSPTDYDDFARRYAAGRASVVATTLVADLETPVSAYLKLAANRAGAMFLLESVEGGAQRGRYSMIGLDPDVVWRSTGEGAEINRRALIEPDAFVPCPGKAARGAAGAARRIAHRNAARPAADVGGRVRLSRLRHGAAHGAAAAGQTRSDRRSRSAARPPDRDGRVRHGARRDGGGDAGRPPPASARAPPTKARRRGSTPSSPRSKRRSTTSRPRWIRRCWPPRPPPTPAKPNIGRWSPRRRNTSSPATRSRSCCRSASPAASNCPPSRSTGRCGASIRRPTSASSISATSRSSSRARRFWSACAAARSASGRSPARAGAARRRARTRRSPPNCSPTRRSAPSI